MKTPPPVDPTKIKSVYIGRNELSPFHESYASENLILRMAAGRCFAHYAGEDIETTYWAVRKTAALYDVPERPIEISGKESVTFLERIFSRPIKDLKVGRGRYTLACTHDGGIFMDGILFRLSTEKFWFIQPDGDFKTWVLAHRKNAKISVSDPNSRVLQLQGPKSFAIVNAATNGELKKDFGYFHSGFFSIDTQNVYISRTGWSGELGYEIYTLGNQTDCPRLWNHLMKIGQPYGMIFSSMQSLNIRRIEAGILDSGSDFDPSITPYQAGLKKFVDFNNKNFIGRNALLTAPEGTHIYGFTCHTAIPMTGNKIYKQNTLVGKITTTGWSPRIKAYIGLVRFCASGNWPNEKLHAINASGSEIKVEIIKLPFFDPLKRLPKTIP